MGKTRPREALPRVPTCPKFSYEALARCPQPMPRTHTFFVFFFGHVVGANGTAAQEGSYGSPLLTTCWGGGYAPVSLHVCVPPGGHHFPAIDREHTPL